MTRDTEIPDFTVKIDTGHLGDGSSIYQRIDYPGVGVPLGGDLHMRVMNTAEAAIRERMIELGWAPPEEVRRLRERILLLGGHAS